MSWRSWSLRRLLLAVVSAVGITTAGFLAAAPEALANAPTAYVHNYRNWLCMDDTGYSISDYTRIELWGCNNGSNQQWRELTNTDCTFSYNGAGCRNYVLIQNVYSGKCLDVYQASSANFTPAVQLWCDTNDYAERFFVAPAIGTSGPPNWQIKSWASGTCLDDPGGSSVWGTKLEFYSCNLTTAQIWYAAGWIGVPFMA